VNKGIKHIIKVYLDMAEDEEDEIFAESALSDLENMINKIDELEKELAELENQYKDLKEELLELEYHYKDMQELE